MVTDFVRSVAYVICFAAISIGSASATTYEYHGKPLDVVIPCCSTTSHGLFWSVTFDFNTFNHSGTVYLHSEHVTAFSGGKENYIPLFEPHFTFSNGAITGGLYNRSTTEIPPLATAALGAITVLSIVAGSDPASLPSTTLPASGLP